MQCQIERTDNQVRIKFRKAVVIAMLQGSCPRPAAGQSLLRTLRSIITTATELTILRGKFTPDSCWDRRVKCAINPVSDFNLRAGAPEGRKRFRLRKLASVCVLGLVTIPANAQVLRQGQPAAKVLALGDSITFGWGDNGSSVVGVPGTAPQYQRVQGAGGYRRFLKGQLVAGNYAIDYVGNVATTTNPAGYNSETNTPYSLQSDPEHAGFSGFPIILDPSPGADQIQGALTAAAMATNPDIVLLHAGTNDLANQVDVAKQVADFGALVDQIYAAKPAVMVVASSLIQKQGINQVNVFNRGAQNVMRRNTLVAGRKAVWAAEMNSALTRGSDFTDDVHPTVAGYEKMANVWKSALTQTPVAAPKIFDFGSARPFALNFVSMGTSQTVSEATGKLAFGPSTLTRRYGAAVYNPQTLEANQLSQVQVEADFRTTDNDQSFGIYVMTQLQNDITDSGGYLVRININTNANGNDGLSLTKSPSFVNFDQVGTQLDSVSTTSLVPNTLFRLMVTSGPGSVPGTVAFDIKVFDVGNLAAGPILSRTYVDSASAFTFGQVGMHFGSVPSNKTVEVDNLTITTSSTRTALEVFRDNNGLPADGTQDTNAPAGDGVANLLKFAFNMIGHAAGQAPSLLIPNSISLTPGGFAGLPFVDSVSGQLQVTYIRRKALTNPGITYTAQFSGTLAPSSWLPDPLAIETSTSIDAAFERVTVTSSSLTGAAQFARIRVSGINP